MMKSLYSVTKNILEIFVFQIPKKTAVVHSVYVDFLKNLKWPADYNF